MATPRSNTVSLSGSTYVDGLIQGGKWTGTTTLTYSFWNIFDGFTLNNWSNTQKDYVRQILSSISNSVNLRFQETSPSGSYLNNSSDISIYQKAWDTTESGFSFFPDPDLITQILPLVDYTRFSYPTADGDVTVNPNSSGWVSGTTPGGDGYWTLIHEIGHALGLKHPFDDGGNGFPTFTQLGITSLDSNAYTVMSYTQHFASLTAGQPATMMPLDIATLQYIYGANTTYHSGDNTYSLTQTGTLQTVWDTGGTDVFDGSSMTTPMNIDLSAGGYSNYGTFNLTAIALGVTIENANGGSSNDTVSGNGAANTLTGNLGGDVLTGLGGADTIYGGTGMVSPTDGDDIVLGGGGSDYLYGNGGADLMFGGTSATDPTDSADAIYGGAGADTIYGNGGADSLFGSADSDLFYGGGGSDILFGGNGVADPIDAADTFYGNDGDDTIYGNGGDDVLRGNAGSDVLYGGAGTDTLYGGTGVDRFFEYTGNGSDVIADFESTDAIWIQSGINGSNIVSTTTALAAATISGTNVLINLGNGAIITILNYSVSSLALDDFVVF